MQVGGHGRLVGCADDAPLHATQHSLGNHSGMFAWCRCGCGWLLLVVLPAADSPVAATRLGQSHLNLEVGCATQQLMATRSVHFMVEVQPADKAQPSALVSTYWHSRLELRAHDSLLAPLPQRAAYSVRSGYRNWYTPACCVRVFFRTPGAAGKGLVRALCRISIKPAMIDSCCALDRQERGSPLRHCSR
jgi:hypothetical protein